MAAPAPGARRGGQRPARALAALCTPRTPRAPRAAARPLTYDFSHTRTAETLVKLNLNKTVIIN